MAAARPLILLTGATGFVGRQVLRELAGRKCRVRLVVTPRQAGTNCHSAAIESVVVDAGYMVRKRRLAHRHLPRRRYRHSRRLVCRARQVSSVAHKPRMPGRHAAAGARREPRPKSDALSASAPALNTTLSAVCLSIETPLRPSTPYAEAKAAVFKALSQKLPRAEYRIRLVPAVLPLRRRRRRAAACALSARPDSRPANLPN